MESGHAWHESFLNEKPKPIRETTMKGILEFSLPVDHKEYYNAVNGYKYRQHLIDLVDELEKEQKQCHDTEKGECLRTVLNNIYNSAAALDIKIFRD